MTVIIGADYGSEILVVADTRVSFQKKYNIPPKDQLIKLIGIKFFRRQAVLGFSGNVPFAKQVIELLRIHAKHSKSCGDLKEDFRRWIEDAVRMKRKRYPVKMASIRYSSRASRRQRRPKKCPVVERPQSALWKCQLKVHV
jgi:hypothetical protein